MVADGEETDEAGDAEADDGTQFRREAKGSQGPVGHSTQHAGDGVDLLVEDDGLVVEQHIADNAASGARDAAHDDGHPKGLPHSKALLDAGDGEERQAEGVEDEPGVFQGFHPLAEEYDGEQGYART